MADTWIVSLRQYLNPDGSIAPKSGPALRFAEYWAAIVQEITADISGELSLPKVRCRRKPVHRPCPGEIESTLDPRNGSIVWECPVCGDNGAISDWEGTFWDLTETSECH
jgi:hypothetical protein